MYTAQEWSGIMWFKTVGDLDDPSKMEFTAVDFIMQDIGVQAHTQFENGTDLIDILEANPELRGCRMGLIHSHNTMPTFFSAEDMDELDDNSQGTDFYLSLIVNNRFEPKAKIAFRGKTQQEGYHDSFIKTTKGEWNSVRQSLKREETLTLFTVDVDVLVPDLVPLDEDIRRYNELRKSKQVTPGYGGQFDHPDYSYDPKAKEKNSGPPNYISQRQSEIDFPEGGKNQLEFLVFLTKWITTDYLFEGTLVQAINKVVKSVGGEKHDIQLYTGLVMDNLISYYEHATGDLIMDEAYELQVCNKIMPFLRGFDKYAVIEALIAEMEENIEGLREMSDEELAKSIIPDGQD